MFQVELSADEMTIIKELCNLGLKTGGLQNLAPVLAVLNALERAKESSKEEDNNQS